MARANFVKRSNKDYPAFNIKKGESYWWWKFRYGGKRMSKVKPSRSQLTQSEFLSAMYDTEDNVSAAVADFRDGGDFEGLASALQEAADAVQEAGESCQDRFDNMPEGLQQGNSGQILENRVQACESLANELESVADQIRDLDPGGEESEGNDEENKADPREEAIGHVEGVSWEYE